MATMTTESLRNVNLGQAVMALEYSIATNFLHYTEEDTGGGCSALVRRFPHGEVLWITDGNLSAPTVEQANTGTVEISFYTDEESVYEGRHVWMLARENGVLFLYGPDDSVTPSRPPRVTEEPGAIYKMAPHLAEIDAGVLKQGVEAVYFLLDDVVQALGDRGDRERMRAVARCAERLEALLIDYA